MRRVWFERDAPTVAPDLLNKVLVSAVDEVLTSGRIIEVEAYMPGDPASHTFRGRSTRNSMMFGPAAHLYVYLSYGIHQCANVVTGPRGSGQAVLIRALAPLDGIDVIRGRRHGRSSRELANGPGKLCQALGIEGAHNGIDLLASGTVRIHDDGVTPPEHPLVGPRIGLTKGVDTPWRFRVPGDQLAGLRQERGEP